MGFTGLVLGKMLADDGILRADDARLPTGNPEFTPKAKSVIWIFLVGGMSHMESFDPKPALNEYAGKTIAESPFKSTLDSPYLKKNLREFVAGLTDDQVIQQWADDILQRMKQRIVEYERSAATIPPVDLT